MKQQITTFFKANYLGLIALISSTVFSVLVSSYVVKEVLYIDSRIAFIASTGIRIAIISIFGIALSLIFYFVTKKLTIQETTFQKALYFQSFTVALSVALSVISSKVIDIPSPAKALISFALGVLFIKYLYKTTTNTAVGALILRILSLIVLVFIFGILMSFISAFKSVGTSPAKHYQTNSINQVKNEEDGVADTISKLPSDFPLPEDVEITGGSRVSSTGIWSGNIYFTPIEGAAFWQEKYQTYIDQNGLIKEEESINKIAITWNISYPKRDENNYAIQIVFNQFQDEGKIGIHLH